MTPALTEALFAYPIDRHARFARARVALACFARKIQQEPISVWIRHSVETVDCIVAEANFSPAVEEGDWRDDGIESRFGRAFLGTSDSVCQVCLACIAQEGGNWSATPVSVIKPN